MMTQIFTLMWEEREGSSFCGAFSSPELAKAHLEKELINFAQRQNKDIEMWKNEAAAVTGNDAKHALRMAGLCQQELDAGLVDLEKTNPRLYETFGANTVAAYNYCGETFSILKNELNVGRRMFDPKRSPRTEDSKLVRFQQRVYLVWLSYEITKARY